MFFLLAGCLYISKSIAGAINTGQRADKYDVTSRLSATALAILPIVLAVAGAITIASAHKPKST